MPKVQRNNNKTYHSIVKPNTDRLNDVVIYTIGISYDDLVGEVRDVGWWINDLWYCPIQNLKKIVS
jgi:hypothetical protein